MYYHLLEVLFYHFLCTGTGVIILCPTRELAMQTYGIVRVFADRHDFSHGVVLGGSNRKAESTHLRKGN